MQKCIMGRGSQNSKIPMSGWANEKNAKMHKGQTLQEDEKSIECKNAQNNKKNITCVMFDVWCVMYDILC